MSFLLPLSSTLLGALLGFSLSLLAFFIRENRKYTTEKEILRKNLIKELEFNVVTLNKFLKDLKEIEIDKAALPEKYKEIYPLPKFIDYMNYFTESYLKQEYLYEKLNTKDVLNLSEISKRMSTGICLSDLKEILDQFINRSEFLEETAEVWEKEIERISLYIDHITQIKKNLES